MRQLEHEGEAAQEAVAECRAGSGWGVDRDRDQTCAAHSWVIADELSEWRQGPAHNPDWLDAFYEDWHHMARARTTRT